MPKAKLYKEIPRGTRQILILAGNDNDQIGAGKSVDMPGVCALLLELIQRGNIPQRKDVNDYLESIKDNIEIAEYKGNFALKDNLSIQQKEVDLMSYLLAGLAGNASDESGKITLGGLCNYVNTQPIDNQEKEGVLSPGGELHYKIIRILPEKVSQAIVDDLNYFYESVKKGHVKLGITRAVDTISKLEFLANDLIIDILKHDVTDALVSNYRDRLDSWISDNAIELSNRVSDRQRQPPQEHYSCLQELQDLLSEKAFRLEKYLSYQAFNDLRKNDKALFYFFCEICLLVRNLEHNTRLSSKPDTFVNQLDTIITNYVDSSLRSKRSDSQIVVNKPAQLGPAMKERT